GLDVAGRVAARLPGGRRAGLALYRFGAVRPVPGRHHPELRRDRARVFFTEGSGRAHGHRHFNHHPRHGGRGLDGRRAVRRDRLLSGRLHQRHRLERAERSRRLVAADATEPSPGVRLTAMSLIDSAYAWRRLAASVALSTLGGIGMWCLAVALPALQADLGITRADISFAYSMNMLGFFAGGVFVGRLVDRRGIVVASIVSAVGLAA